MRSGLTSCRVHLLVCVLVISTAFNAHAKSQTWHVETHSDPLTDAKTISVEIEAVNAIRNSIGQPVTPIIGFSCTIGSGGYIVIQWGRFVSTGDGELSLEYPDLRIDKGPVLNISTPGWEKLASWSMSSDGKSMGYNGSTAAFENNDNNGDKALILKLIGAQRFLVSVQPTDEQPIIAEFNMSDLGKVINKVAKPCGWDMDLPTDLQ
jgi:hypothetical protein